MKKRKLLSFFLCVLMVVQIGCSKTADSNEASNATEEVGRYVEQELKLPELSAGEKFLTLVTDEDSNITYYSLLYTGEKKEIYQYSFVNDTYEKKQITYFDEFLQGNSYEITLCLGEDGLYYLLVKEMEDISQDSKTQEYIRYSYLYRSNKEFTACEEVTPETWNQEDSGSESMKGTSVSNIQVTSSGILLYKDHSTKEILSYSLIDKKPILDYDLSSFNEYLVKENTVYYIPLDGKEIWSFNYDTEEERQYPCEMVRENSRIQVSREGTLYLLDGNGIHRLAKETTLWETVVEGRFYTMSVPSMEGKAFLIKQDEKEVYYVFYQSNAAGKENSLAGYEFDSTALPIVEKELTVYSLWDNASLREAISQFQKEHIGLKINYNIALSEGSGATVADQIKALNTELLAGKGADIFLLDGLPMETYIEKGVLLDLSDILMPMVKKEELWSNIANDFVQDDAIYGMPIRFYIPVYTTSEDIKEATGSLEQLSQLAASSDQPLFPLMSYKDLLQTFLYTYYEPLVTDKGELKEEEIRTFLIQTKRIADNIGIDSESEVIMYETNLDGISTRASAILKHDIYQLQSYETLAVMTCVNTILDIMYCDASAAKEGGECYPVNDTYVPNGIIGINKASKETALSKEFIQYLFSEKNQLVQVGDGFSMNIAAFDSWVREEENAYNVWGGKILTSDDRVYDIYVGDVTSENSPILYSVIKQVKTPVNNNAYVMYMITEEALPYFTGEKDLDTVCENIMNKVNLYLSEQN